MPLVLAAILALLLTVASAHAEPCCGPITPNGERLLARLDASGVDHLWLPHQHIHWETGELDNNPSGRRAPTHCSAFVAAFSKALGIYVLRPPDHSLTFLASAQMRWLTFDGPAAGWRRLPDAAAAQRSANQGNLVVVAYENPDRHKPGHIAFVRPGLHDLARLSHEGPHVTQAGGVNAIPIPLPGLPPSRTSSGSLSTDRGAPTASIRRRLVGIDARAGPSSPPSGLTFLTMFLWQRSAKHPGRQDGGDPGFGEAILLPVPALGDSGDLLDGRPVQGPDTAGAGSRTSEASDFLADHRIRFGFRKTDVPPAGLTRQVRYGKVRVGQDAAMDFLHLRVNPVTVSVNPENAAMVNRRSDREDNVKTFWASQTQQSHHIVEYNHLNGIDVSNPVGLGELDHGQLPCVLLAAEFHQRWVSSTLKKTHGWKKAQLLTDLPETYQSIYAIGGPLRPLWSVSRLILRAAGVAVP